MVLLAPLYVARMFGGCILFHKASDNFLCIVELVETVAEQSCLREMLNMRLPALQLVELDAKSVEDASY